MDAQPIRVAIVGGGFTGAAAALALLDRLPHPFRMTLIEPEPDLGRGLAYGKADPFHLLNVRAGNLSIRADSPGDFAAWAGARQDEDRPPRDLSSAFLPRLRFGDYAASRLAERAAQRPDVAMTHRRALAIRLDRGASAPFRLQLSEGPAVEADIVCLASGYGRPPADGRFGPAAFHGLDPERVSRARTALFVGTGLTFVDQWLRITRAGFRGVAFAVSRRGLLPARHTSPVQACENPLAERGDLAAHVGRLRRVMSERHERGIPPGDLVAAMRTHVQDLWQALEPREQSRFLRHLRPHWDRLRHRLPPFPHDELMAAQASGDLTVRPRRLAGGPAGGLPAADLVFDCSGHRADIATPLMRSLTACGLAAPDGHRLGLAVRPNGEALGPQGTVTPGLFVLGPLGQGSLYEITAVREIVGQCAAAAESVARGAALNAFPSARAS